MAASIRNNIDRMNNELDNLRHAYHRMMAYNVKIDQGIENATEEEKREIFETRKLIKKYLKRFSARMDKVGGDFDDIQI